ncbi:hypothetical protein MMPV_001447 [Pyropia vietnamensis]
MPGGPAQWGWTACLLVLVVAIFGQLRQPPPSPTRLVETSDTGAFAALHPSLSPPFPRAVPRRPPAAPPRLVCDPPPPVHLKSTALDAVCATAVAVTPTSLHVAFPASLVIETNAAAAAAAVGGRGGGGGGHSLTALVASVATPASLRTVAERALVLGNGSAAPVLRAGGSVHVLFEGLLPDEPWVVALTGRRLARRVPLCRITLSTLAAVAGGSPDPAPGADGPPLPPAPPSLAINGGFEAHGAAPYGPTRPTGSGGLANPPRRSAAGWTPFYNGAYARVCGILPLAGLSSGGVPPLLGRCALQLGTSSSSSSSSPGSGGGGGVDAEERYYGAHQAVWVPPVDRGGGFLLSVWYTVSPDLASSVAAAATAAAAAADAAGGYVAEPDRDRSETDAFSLAVSWTYESPSTTSPPGRGVLPPIRSVEPAVVPLDAAAAAPGTWARTCVYIPAAVPGAAGADGASSRRIRLLHAYLHLHHRRGNALFDAFMVHPVGAEDGGAATAGCAILERHPIGGSGNAAAARRDPGMEAGMDHRLDGANESAPVRPPRLGFYAAAVRPTAGQLSLAVALTSERLLRLEALAAAYREGPVVAAVLVKDRDEATGVLRLWSRLPALRQHVDLQLYGPPTDAVTDDVVAAGGHARGSGRSDDKAFTQGAALPINALRNAAVALASTDYVAMLDVDLLPSSSLACFHTPGSAGRLSAMLPTGGAPRGLVLPMFISDVGMAVPRTKSALLNQLGARLAAPYCLISQAATAYDRWYRSTAAAEARFVPGYEPYVALRTADAGTYDERFVGYGFNKVAWTWSAATRGVRLVVSPTDFVVHANHADNGWVAHIHRGGYLMTWRRYLAFVAEEATAERWGAPGAGALTASAGEGPAAAAEDPFFSTAT